MAVERGDSSASVGATVDDSPSTFEQSTLKGTTTTGNARLIVRDATQIAVIDTYNYWTSNTVEGVLDEIANLTGLGSNIQDQIDAIVIRVTDNEADIVLLEAADVTLQDNIDTEEAARIAADTVVDDANLSLDGSDTMTGAINTSVGTMYSTKASSATDAPWQMTNNSDIYSNITYRYMSCLDVNNKGLVISNELGFAGSKQLLIDASGYTGTFDSLKFKGGGFLGQIFFSTNGSANSLGFNPGANSVISDHATEITLSANAGGTNLALFKDTQWRPYTSGAVDLAQGSYRFKDGYFTGAITTSKAAPTDDSELTRKDYVDTKAVDEAIAFAIALGG